MDGEGNDEILALEAIYEEQLSIKDVSGGKRLGITVYPATADDPSSQYVCLDLSLFLSQKYPLEAPEIGFTKSRGLSDTSLNELRSKMQELLKDRTGECVLFDLLDMAKDKLTFNNIPSGVCSVCLSGFEEGDEFLKTECFHYFHCYCLNSYKKHLDSEDENGYNHTQSKISTPWTHSKVMVPCPVCRLPVALDLKAIQDADPPIDSNSCEIDEKAFKAHYEKFNERYQKQLRNGGLIDLKHEQNKYMLSHIQQAYENRKKSEARDVEKQDEESKFGTQKSSPESPSANTCSQLPENDANKSKSNHPSHRSHSGRKHWHGNDWRDKHSHSGLNRAPQYGAQSQYNGNRGQYVKNNWRRKGYNHAKPEGGEAKPQTSKGRCNSDNKDNDRPQQSHSLESESQPDSENYTAQGPRSSRNGRQEYGSRSFSSNSQNGIGAKHRRPKSGTKPKVYASKFPSERSLDQKIGLDTRKQQQTWYPKYKPQSNRRSVNNSASSSKDPPDESGKAGAY